MRESFDDTESYRMFAKRKKILIHPVATTCANIKKNDYFFFYIKKVFIHFNTK